MHAPSHVTAVHLSSSCCTVKSDSDRVAAATAAAKERGNVARPSRCHSLFRLLIFTRPPSAGRKGCRFDGERRASDTGENETRSECTRTRGVHLPADGRYRRVILNMFIPHGRGTTYWKIEIGRIGLQTNRRPIPRGNYKFRVSLLRVSRRVL